jgi:hypothetical protein
MAWHVPGLMQAPHRPPPLHLWFPDTKQAPHTRILLSVTKEEVVMTLSTWNPCGTFTQGPTQGGGSTNSRQRQTSTVVSPTTATSAWLQARTQWGLARTSIWSKQARQVPVAAPVSFYLTSVSQAARDSRDSRALAQLVSIAS